MATQRTKIGGVGPAASQHALDTAVSGKPAGGRDSGLQVLAQSPGWYQKATDGRGHDRSDSHCWGPPLLDDAAVFRTLSLAELSVPSSRARLQDSCATAGGLPRRLFHHGSRLLPAHRLHSLSQPQREASGLRNERNSVQLTERDRNDRRSIGSGTLCDAAVASRVSLEAASHVVAGDGWADKLQPGGWPAYTCNKPPNTTDGRHHQWLIASHSGGSAPPEKPASSFSRRATTVGEVKPERQSNRANTKSVAPQHSYAVGFLPRLFLHDGKPVFATAELPLPGPRSGRLVQGICWTPPRSTSDPVSLTMAGPSISP